jgi:hypothetical protein
MTTEPYDGEPSLLFLLMWSVVLGCGGIWILSHFF